MTMWDTPYRKKSCTGNYTRGSKKLCRMCSPIIPSATNQNKDHGEMNRTRWIPDYRIIIPLKTTGYDIYTLTAPSSWSLFFLRSTTTNLKRTRQQNSFSRFSIVSFFNFQGFQGPFQNSRLFQGFPGFQGLVANLA